MERVDQYFKYAEAKNNIIYLKKAYPFHFITSNDKSIGSLSFLCITEDDKRIILSCNYLITDYEAEMGFSYCKLYNNQANSSSAKNIAILEMIKSLDNYLIDLNINLNYIGPNLIKNQMIGCKVDNKGALVPEYALFSFDDNLLSIFGFANDNITNYAGLNYSFDDICTNLNAAKISNIHFIEKNIVKIISMAPLGTSRKTNDVIVWFEVMDTVSDHKESTPISIVAEFSLDNPLKKKVFKGETKSSLESKYTKNRTEKDYITIAMCDFDLFKYRNDGMLMIGRDKNKKYHLIFLEYEIIEKLLNFINNY